MLEAQSFETFLEVFETFLDVFEIYMAQSFETFLEVNTLTKDKLLLVLSQTTQKQHLTASFLYKHVYAAKTRFGRRGTSSTPACFRYKPTRGYNTPRFCTFEEATWRVQAMCLGPWKGVRW
jgi:hypothetical protein